MNLSKKKIFIFRFSFCVPACDSFKTSNPHNENLCRSLSSDASFITKFSLVIKGNGAEKVRDLEHGVFPRLHVMQNADAFGFPSHSSSRLCVWGPTVLRDGHTGSRRRQGKDMWWLDWRFLVFLLCQMKCEGSPPPLLSTCLYASPSLLIFLPSATSNNSLLGYGTRQGLLWLAPALLLTHSHLIPPALGTGVSCQQQ